jgi:hypothetical protein
MVILPAAGTAGVAVTRTETSLLASGQDKIQPKSGNSLSNFVTSEKEFHSGTLWLNVAVTDETAP